MKPKLINDPYRNPFHNRFHVPVHSRLIDAVIYEHGLAEREPIGPEPKLK